MIDVRLRVRLERILLHVQRQHLELAELEASFRVAIDRDLPSDIGIWCGRYCDAFLAHFKLEETVLFPILLLIDSEAKSDVRALEQEHRSMRNVLRDLETIADARVMSARVSSLRKRVNEHEGLEESLVAGIRKEIYEPSRIGSATATRSTR